MQLTENLELQNENLQETAKVVKQYYMETPCTNQTKKRINPSSASYYFMPNNLNYQYSEMKKILEALLRKTKDLNTYTPRSLMDESDIGLFFLMERISLFLQRNTLTNQLIANILCEQDYNAFLQMATGDMLRDKITLANQNAIENDCQIPMIIDEIDLLKLLEISEIQADLLADTFTVNLKIPSIYQRKYNLYQVISLPFLYQNNTYALKPNYPYYLISESAHDGITFLYTMRLEDIDNCTQWSTHLICRPETPLKLTHRTFNGQREEIPSVERCANKSPEEVFKASDFCEIFDIPNENKIIKITKSTHYIYIIRPTVMTIKCPNKSENLTLNESRLIALRSGCELVLFPNVIPIQDEIFMERENLIYFRRDQANVTTSKNSTIESKIWHVMLTLCFLILFIMTWVGVGYNNRQFLKQIRRFTTNWQNNTPNNSVLDFNCSFSFCKPALPIKKRKRSRSHDQTSEKPLYDVPRKSTTSLVSGSAEITAV